jgi:fecR protein
MKYKEKDIEFANQILTRRSELDDDEVRMWMDDPEHAEILKEFAAIQGLYVHVDFEKDRIEEYARFERVTGGRSHRRIVVWSSVAASVILMVGLYFSWMLGSSGEVSPLGLAGQAESFKPGTNAVELILDNGEKVVLDGKAKSIANHAVSGIQDDSLRGLTYARVQVNESEELIYNTLKVPTGGFYQLELADGTKVWLNSESELRFPVRFAAGGRDVYLKGEAYFQVKKNEGKPFTVFLNESSVTVLGTSFNIKAYKDEENIYTTLVEGSVRFSVEKGGEPVVLHPGMQSVWNVESGKTEVKKVDVNQFIAWRDGRFVFPSTTLEELMMQLKRWYNIEVEFEVPEVRRYEFRGAISRDMELANVLSLVEKTSNVVFIVHGRKINVAIKN